MVLTYSGIDLQDGSVTQGGYSEQIVVRQQFVCSLPESLDISRAAPLLCAGITTYSPLRKFGVGPGQKVGIAGLGGLGHMGVKFAAAMGAHVTMITTSPGKGEDARGRAEESPVDGSGAMRRRQSSIHPQHIPVGNDVGPM